ncbi:MAG: DUF2914 domain-containing protein [Bdellovibrionota bacterium]
MLVETFQKHYQKHAKTAPAMSFALGFVFDIATMGRIDSAWMIAQQGLYLAIVGVLVLFELWEKLGDYNPRKHFKKFWRYQEAVVHFFLGALLSAYTLFYFKSASVFSAFLFLFLLSALLIANEFERVRRAGIALRFGMFSLCLASYLIYTMPIFLGFLGDFPFLLSISLSTALGTIIYYVLRDQLPDKARLRRQALYPHLAVHLIFTVLYFLRAIPPVPLSISYMGVYHDITKKGDEYHLSYTRPSWKFWQNGDQVFEYVEGDKLFGFASIFSPSGFKDNVYVRWLYKEGKQGWQTQDLIPIQITGGRDEGFRGYTVKEHFRPGSWRFQVETEDGREIGRLYFEIEAISEIARRESNTEIR